MKYLAALLTLTLISLTFPGLSWAGGSDEWLGTYEFSGDLRLATISKVILQRVNGQPRMHVWFYSKPDDIDWGEVSAKEYRPVSKGIGDIRKPDFKWSAALHHGNQDAILIVVPYSSGPGRGSKITVQSFTSFQKTDTRHENTADEDYLSLESTEQAEKDTRAPIETPNTEQSYNAVKLPGYYIMDLRRRIHRVWFPPKGSQSLQPSVVFNIDAQGKISDVRIDKSCGNAAADEAALLAVKNAAPFKELPEGISHAKEFRYTFDYNVTGSRNH